jgi:hypothetical protein
LSQYDPNIQIESDSQLKIRNQIDHLRCRNTTQIYKLKAIHNNNEVCQKGFKLSQYDPNIQIESDSQPFM